MSTEPRRDPDEQTLQRLISDTISQDEVAPLVEAVLLSRKAIEDIGNLQGNGAQVIIDILDKVPCFLRSLRILSILTFPTGPRFCSAIRSECLKLLYRACADHALLPRSLQVGVDDTLTGVPVCRDGFGDVRKCEYQGQQVAVKVLRTYGNDDPRKFARVSHWCSWLGKLSAIRTYCRSLEW